MRNISEKEPSRKTYYNIELNGILMLNRLNTI